MTEQKKQHPLAVFKGNMEKMIGEKEFALPSNVTPEAFKNAAMVAVQDAPDILKCDQHSVFRSLRRLAAAGLVPDGRESALVTFNVKVKTQDGKENWVKKCQAMPMVFGLIKMARRSGEISDIRAHIVYQNEVDQGKFSYVVGDTEKLDHEPIVFGDKGEPVAVYAIARMKDGTVAREVMGADEVDKVRRAGSSQRLKGGGVSDKPIGIWDQWSTEMWKKTAIRRLCKRLDLSSEDMRRVMVEPDLDEAMRDVTPKEERKPSRVQQKFQEARGEIQPQDEQAEDQPTDQADDATIEGTAIDTDSEDYLNGMVAFEDGKGRGSCPIQDDAKALANWMAGYDHAQKSAEATGQ